MRVCVCVCLSIYVCVKQNTSDQPEVDIFFLIMNG